MATPIPGFASKIESSGESVTVNAGSPAVLADTRWYYFVSNRTAQSNGQSFLKAFKDTLDSASSGISTTWTVVLVATGGLYKIKLTHNNGSARTLDLVTA